MGMWVGPVPGELEKAQDLSLAVSLTTPIRVITKP